MDGVDVSDPEIGSQWVLPSMDWVQEVQVAGLGADAEYGGFTGAVVNLITKSGGNTFHGNVRAYYSGGSLNSDNAPPTAEGTNKVDSDTKVVRVSAAHWWRRAVVFHLGKSAAAYRRAFLHRRSAYGRPRE